MTKYEFEIEIESYCRTTPNTPIPVQYMDCCSAEFPNYLPKSPDRSGVSANEQHKNWSEPDGITRAIEETQM